MIEVGQSADPHGEQAVWGIAPLAQDDGAPVAEVTLVGCEGSLGTEVVRQTTALTACSTVAVAASVLCYAGPGLDSRESMLAGAWGPGRVLAVEYGALRIEYASTLVPSDQCRRVDDQTPVGMEGLAP